MAQSWDWNQWMGACDNTTYNYTQPIYTSGSSMQTQVYPAMVAVPGPADEPQDDSPLAWLRSQVAEITELAHAA